MRGVNSEVTYPLHEPPAVTHTSIAQQIQKLNSLFSRDLSHLLPEDDSTYNTHLIEISDDSDDSDSGNHSMMFMFIHKINRNQF